MPSSLKSGIEKSIEAKIIIALGLILTVILSAYSAFDIWLESRGAYQLAFSELEVLANTIQKALIKDMREGRSADVQQILEMVGTEKGILAVRVFDESGRVLKSASRAEVGQNLAPVIFKSFKAGRLNYVSERAGVKVFNIMHPIANAPPCYGCHGRERELNGVLNLEYSLEPVQGDVSRHVRQTLVALALTITALGLALYILLKILVSDPIKRMKAAMAQAEKGDLAVRIPVDSEDEIGSLQQSFNNMLARLKDLNEKNLEQRTALVRKEQELEMQQVLEDRNKALEAANLEATQKNRYYMEMLSFISHELKNPLFVLKGYTAMMLKGDLGEMKRAQMDAAAAMERNVDALQEMIANYLDLTRIERGELKLEKRRIDLVEDVIRPVMADYAEALEKASMTMRTEGATEAILITADPALMKSVVGNLVSNAVKYGRRGTDILLEVESSRSGARLSVFNEGDGIPYADLERIFERFTRLGEEGDRTQKGSGLGLCIVKEIVELHGGRVWAESKEGAWAKITLTLPAEGQG